MPDLAISATAETAADLSRFLHRLFAFPYEVKIDGNTTMTYCQNISECPNTDTIERWKKIASENNVTKFTLWYINGWKVECLYDSEQ